MMETETETVKAPEGLSAVALIKKYFEVNPDGYQGRVGLPGFLAEIKELSIAGKQELAQLISVELGIPIKK